MPCYTWALWNVQAQTLEFLLGTGVYCICFCVCSIYCKVSLVKSGGWEESVYWHVYCTSVYCLLQGAICVYPVYTCLLQVEMPTKVAGDVYFSGWCLLQGAMCVYTSRPAVDTNSKGCLLQYMGCTAVCYLPSPPDRKPPHTHQARNHHTRNHHTR